MDTTGRYYTACCQTDFPSPKTQAEISSRVDRMLEMIDSAVLGYDPFFPVRLVVFPEFAQTPPVYFTVEELRERLAVPIPNEHTDRYTARRAQSLSRVRRGMAVPAMTEFIYSSRAGRPCHEPDAGFTDL